MQVSRGWVNPHTLRDYSPDQARDDATTHSYLATPAIPRNIWMPGRANRNTLEKNVLHS